ncbi:MAG: 23S rRNA (pseudouridine(1915)-N(3))-methyltransferase RlmH [Pseudomonadales bacterium]|nr:23S rRNA (pseudouridine(1915)-N(3))-methyltransferase RlmH [Pseudomonadales bacterium]
MRVRLICVGTRMPQWVTSGFGEYQKRLVNDLRLELVEVSAGVRNKNADLKRIVAKEGEALLKAVPKGDLLIALDLTGKQWSTEQLSKDIVGWQGQGRDVSLLVGGPDGLHASCIQRAEFSRSLSKLTLPHPLVRVLMAEQIYRAWSLSKGHPYHR